MVVGDTMTLLVGIGSSSERVKQSARGPDILLIQIGLVHRRCNLSESGDSDNRVARFNNLRIGKSVNADLACVVPTERLHSAPLFLRETIERDNPIKVTSD